MSRPADLHWLTNSQFELAVSPGTGRIVRYGPVGGQNMLWDNPKATETPTVFPGWINWGGDKVWIWPEHDWAKWAKTSGPPPGDPAAGPYQVEAGGRHVRMASPVVPGYGLRIVREISLAASGPGVSIVNRLEQISPAAESLSVSPWTVTQVPAPTEVLARLLPGAVPGYEAISPNAWNELRRVGDVLVLTRPANPWVKLGLDADALAVPVGGWLFVARTAAGSPGNYEPLRRGRSSPSPTIPTFACLACRPMSRWNLPARWSGWPWASRSR